MKTKMKMTKWVLALIASMAVITTSEICLMAGGGLGQDDVPLISRVELPPANAELPGEPFLAGPGDQAKFLGNYFLMASAPGEAVLSAPEAEKPGGWAGLLIQAIPLLTVVITWGVGKLAPLIPRNLLPLVSAGVGALIPLVDKFELNSNTLKGAVLGLAGVGVHQLYKQLKAAPKA